MNRVQIDIGIFSTGQIFNDPSIKNAVVFIHGIFGDSRETWGATPLQLISAPHFQTFDWYSCGYSSRIVDFRHPELFVDQLNLFIRAQLHQYENVYFVAHSMGGLLLRHVVTNILLSADDRQLAKKIRLCFMIASPVSGSWLARLLCRVPVLRHMNRRLGYLARPQINLKDMSAAYAEAISRFLREGGNPTEIPRFHYFVGTDDKLVSPPESMFYTEYDKYEGALEGGHRALALDGHANSVLIKRITQLMQDSMLRSEESQRAKITIVKEYTKKRELAAERKATRPPEAQDAVDVVLISCSATKTDADEVAHQKSGGIVDFVADDRIANLVMEMRSKVLRLIQEGKIDGIEFAQGNRASMPVNKELLLGPDFGGAFNEPKYLPALARYRGRGYQASKEEWREMLGAERHPWFLIMSGLYGLIPPTEYIQNYDVHLTDADMSSGISLQTYWRDRELMTQVLISHVEWIEKQGFTIGNIIDALSELSYQETINWALVDSRWSVLHRVFESSAGRDALGNLGTWLQDVIKNPRSLRAIKADEFYNNPRFHPADRIAFEKRIGGTSLVVTREINQ